MNLIRDALKKALKARDEVDAEEEELNISLYVRGAPIYRFVISARDYQLAEELMSKALHNIESSLAEYNATVKVVESK